LSTGFEAGVPLFRSSVISCNSLFRKGLDYCFLRCVQNVGAFYDFSCTSQGRCYDAVSMSRIKTKPYRTNPHTGLAVHRTTRDKFRAAASEFNQTQNTFLLALLNAWAGMSFAQRAKAIAAVETPVAVEA
jgi:hypothetical protein